MTLPTLERLLPRVRPLVVLQDMLVPEAPVADGAGEHLVPVRRLAPVAAPHAAAAAAIGRRPISAPPWARLSRIFRFVHPVAGVIVSPSPPGGRRSGHRRRGRRCMMVEAEEGRAASGRRQVGVESKGIVKRGGRGRGAPAVAL